MAALIAQSLRSSQLADQLRRTSATSNAERRQSDDVGETRARLDELRESRRLARELELREQRWLADALQLCDALSAPMPLDPRQQLDRAIDLGGRLVTDHPERLEARRLLANALQRRARLRPDGADAVADQDRAVALYRHLVALEPHLAKPRRELAEALEQRSRFARRAADLVRAEAALRDALVQRQAVIEHSGGGLAARRQLAATQRELAALLSETGQLDAARELLGEAVASLEMEDALPAAMMEQAEDLETLGHIQLRLGAPAAAMRSLGQALDRLDAVPAGRDEAAPPSRREVRRLRSRLNLMLAEAQVNAGQYRAAASTATTALNESTAGAESYRRAAVVLARAAGAARDDSRLNDVDRAAASHELAERAMASLRAAVERGYRGGPDLESDSVWKPLRHRDDFQQLVREAKDDPPADLYLRTFRT